MHFVIQIHYLPNEHSGQFSNYPGSLYEWENVGFICLFECWAEAFGDLLIQIEPYSLTHVEIRELLHETGLILCHPAEWRQKQEGASLMDKSLDIYFCTVLMLKGQIKTADWQCQQAAFDWKTHAVDKSCPVGVVCCCCFFPFFF